MIDSYTVMPPCGHPAIVKIDGDVGGVVSITTMMNGIRAIDEVKDMILGSCGDHGVSYNPRRMTEVQLYHSCVQWGVPFWPPKEAIPYFQQVHEYDPEKYGPSPVIDEDFSIEINKPFL